MGHLASKDIYRQLGHRLDQSTLRTPWTPAFRQLIEALYSPAEAELMVFCRWAVGSNSASFAAVSRHSAVLP